MHLVGNYEVSKKKLNENKSQFDDMNEFIKKSKNSHEIGVFTMIPKIIHYCWFGRNPLTDLAQKCIASWKVFCPDYEIKEWNESNFDVNCCDYVKEAYKANKFAFVSDYARLYVLVNNGGIYMDTDVEVLKSLDIFLNEHAFSGFETEQNVPTGIMACQKGNVLFKQLLADYENRIFTIDAGCFDLTTNVVVITKFFLAQGLVSNNKKQTICGCTLFPKEYFCPKNYKTGIIEKTDNTYTIHHFSGSWMTHAEMRHRKLGQKTRILFGMTIGNYIEKVYSFPYRFLRKIKEKRFLGTIKFVYEKLFFDR